MPIWTSFSVKNNCKKKAERPFNILFLLNVTVPLLWIIELIALGGLTLTLMDTNKKMKKTP